MSEQEVEKKPSLNYSVIQELRELQSPDDPRFVVNILTLFLETATSVLKKVEIAVREKNSQNIFTESHSLKSSCLNAGAERMGDLCQLLETKGKNNDLTGTEALLTQITNEFLVVKQELFKLREFQRKVA
jgi:HPt (histidine-containing phosphotransfer) domain-containing protein